MKALLRDAIDGFEIIRRPESFIFKAPIEGDHHVRRIILLPPHGFTADQRNLMNSHDEAERATIEVKGAVREGKKGFSKIKDCLLVAEFGKGAMSPELNKPYRTFDPKMLSAKGLSARVYSAGEAPLTVVRPNGEGFYHNLINLSNDWLVLDLKKKLRPQKPVDLAQLIKGLNTNDRDILNGFYEKVTLFGDEIFEKDSDIIDQVVAMNPTLSLPALTEMLYVYDSGKHEACSVFAVILKLGKQFPEFVIEHLSKAIQNDSVPTFYANQLIKKIAANSNFPPEIGASSLG